MKSLLHSLTQAITHIGRFIIGFILMLIGICLFPLVTLASIIFYFATLQSKRQNAGEILEGNGESFKQIGVGYDILGNIVGGPFFNWLLLKKPSKFPFGVAGEKISTVLHLNFRMDNLSEWGENLRYDLDSIEFDHCEKSLAYDLEKAVVFLDKYKKMHAEFETIERTKEFLAKYN